MRILKQSSDPDIKKSVYALFAALSIVMKDEISPVLPDVINEMIESIQSTEGIIVSPYRSNYHIKLNAMWISDPL